jgi:hypothetical protein
MRADLGLRGERGSLLTSYVATSGAPLRCMIVSMG